MACVVSGLAGLGAEVVFTGLFHEPWQRWGWGRAHVGYLPLYACAPIVLPLLPAPRLAWATAVLFAVDLAVRMVQRQGTARIVRAVAYAPAWALLAVALEWISAR